MKKIISKSNKAKDGKKMQQVVYITADKEVNGKQKYKSITRHEPQ